MRLKIHLVICTLVYLAAQSSGSFREHREFTVKEISEVVPELIEAVTMKSSRGVLTKDSGFSVWVSRLESGSYTLTFVTRFEVIGAVPEKTDSHQSISFQSVPDAKLAGGLTPDHERTVTEALGKIGPFVVTNTLTKDSQKGTLVSSIQEVKCKVSSQEEAVELIKVFFSGFPEKMQLWEDDAQ